MTLPTEDLAPEAPNAELVHWMEPRRSRAPAAALPAVAVAAFALGVAAAFGALALLRWIAPPKPPTLH